ncbi:hypothetical protein [Sphingobium naphthae]|uniref:Uncharacterized protein n=1 Tax=Sphingobium naphthae TaxID=1886786 RepID=A0ABU4A1X4_9SPHN|nr:hypothetical protein [Sphingobium naphthae]MDV5825749.1 hypothetical protein [Sphingobium naphthae]
MSNIRIAALRGSVSPRSQRYTVRRENPELAANASMLTPALVRRREKSETDDRTATSGNICATLSWRFPIFKNKTRIAVN